MTRVKIDVPFDDKAMSAGMAGMTLEIKEQISAHVSAHVHTTLNAMIRRPTPYYETQIVTERQGNDLVVHDSGVIYGPWLEGTGSRNAPETSFAGYGAFGKAEASVTARLGSIIDPIMRKWVAWMSS